MNFKSVEAFLFLLDYSVTFLANKWGSKVPIFSVSEKYTKFRRTSGPLVLNPRLPQTKDEAGKKERVLWLKNEGTIKEVTVRWLKWSMTKLEIKHPHWQLMATHQWALVENLKNSEMKISLR